MVALPTPTAALKRSLFTPRTLTQTLALAGSLLLPALSLADSSSDRLAQPPLTSALAQQSLLLDITQAGNRLVAVGERGHVLYSDDKGQHWQQADVPSRSALTAVFFSDSQHGWAVGHDGLILASTDGGAHWHKQLDGKDINQLQLDVARQQLAALQQTLADSADPDQQETLELAIEEAEYAVEDAVSATEDGPGAPLLDIWFANAQHGFVVGAYGTLLRTQDGGSSWQSVANGPDNPDRLHLNAINATTSGQLLIAGEAGSLFRSSDHGDSWQTLDSPYEGSFFGISQSQTNGVLLYGLRGHAFHSADNGDNWQAINSTSQTSYFSSTRLADGSVLLVGGNGSLSHASSSQPQLQPLKKRERRPLSGLVALDDRLVLIGAGGISSRALPPALLSETARSAEKPTLAAHKPGNSNPQEAL